MVIAEVDLGGRLRSRDVNRFIFHRKRPLERLGTS